MNHKTCYAQICMWMLLLLSCTPSTSDLPGDDKPTLVAIFAHPDDETTVAPILSRYASSHNTYLIIATDGRYGVTEHAKIPEGDSLVDIRSKELACSCEAMNIHPPIQLGILDGMGSDVDMGIYHEQLALLKSKLQSSIDTLQPDIVITYGPDGDTGHPDHRIIGAVTTEVLLHQSIDSMPLLYYFGWTPKLALSYEDWNLNYLHPSQLNTVVSYTEEDKQALYNSIRCYKSQYSSSRMEWWINIEKANPDNKLYFRSYQSPQHPSSKL